MEIPGVDGVQLDVIQDLKDSKWTGVFETVLMNPPFGTKHNAGMDIKFLETGIALAGATVYSLHKTTTRYDLFNFRALPRYHYSPTHLEEFPKFNVNFYLSASSSLPNTVQLNVLLFYMS